MKWIRRVLPFAAVMSLSAQSWAGITVYETVADFQAVFPVAAIDSFDDLPVGAELPTPLNRQAGPFTYVVSTGPVSDFLTASDGGTDVWLSTNAATDSIVISGLPSATRGVGVYLFATDIAGNATTGAAVSATLMSGGDSVTRTVDSPTTTSFLGFIATEPIQSLTISLGNASGAWPTVNNVMLLASAVPEPDAAYLAVVGLVLVGTACFLQGKRLLTKQPALGQ